ncbi:MAG: hypothetical protein IJ264_05125 [Clostridia bacterium]|nr:hypothetical protein [Clostridia bacterium]
MLSKTEINTGRQVEFDYLKGLFIPIILLIHSFQVLGGDKTPNPAYQITYIAATMTGSAIFLFVMGLGSTYSKRSEKQLTKDGLKLIVQEFIWNVLAFTVPMVIGQLLLMLFGKETAWDTTKDFAVMMVQYINIFFIAGVCYLLIVLLHAVKTPEWLYFVLALAFMIINPFLFMKDKSTGNAVLDYVLTTFAGGRSAVSLCCLTHIPYVLLGVGFGKILRRTENKARLYAVVSVPAAITVIIYFVYAISNNSGLDALYAFSRTGYIYPGTLKALANCSSVLLTSALLYGLRNVIGAVKPLHNALIHFNKKTTIYYAVHPFFYCLLNSLMCYKPLSPLVCAVATPIVWALCWLSILAWEHLRGRQKTVSNN